MLYTIFNLTVVLVLIPHITYYYKTKHLREIYKDNINLNLMLYSAIGLVFALLYLKTGRLYYLETLEDRKPDWLFTTVLIAYAVITTLVLPTIKVPRPERLPSRGYQPDLDMNDKNDDLQSLMYNTMCSMVILAALFSLMFLIGVPEK